MNKITLKEILQATGGVLKKECGEKYITGVKHDSRECAAGDMFVAIRGENQDGHRYIPQVLDAGCRTVMVSHLDGWHEEAAGKEANIILVEDTVYAMGELAKYYLETLDVKKVAVTGSVGKTSTRDMIYYALCEKYNCGRNMKNFNNDIGLPLSIFQFDSTTEAVVLEMGMDHFGEIDRLAEIVKPHIAVITNIGMAHIENLGSREGIFRAKMEITKHLTAGESDPVLIFPDDGEFLTKEKTAGDYMQIAVGQDGRSDYILSDIEDLGIDGIAFTLEHKEESRQISLPVPGSHNAGNATLAIAVGNMLGMTVEEAVSGLSKTVLTGDRLRAMVNERAGITVINDTYNASPDSMEGSLKVLYKSRCEGKKVAVLGDMLALGEESRRQHHRVGLFAAGLHIDTVIAVGEAAGYIAEGAASGSGRTAYFKNKEDFYKEIDQFIGFGDIILVKGSRGMKMEQVVEKLMEL